MRALHLDQGKQLKFVEATMPEVGPDEVLVKIKAAALNHRELWITKGLYPGMRLPCILGADGAGMIHDTGSDVDPKLKGKEVIIYPGRSWGPKQSAPDKAFRVLGMPDAGTFAEYISVHKDLVFPKPSHFSWEEAAAIPVAGLTAWRALYYYGNIQSGDKVLITGIGGGVAQIGLTLALSFGAEVYVTSSSPDKIQKAIKRGAKAGVNYKDFDWPDQLKELAGTIDLVLDSSPREVFDGYFRFLQRGAKVIAYGSQGSRKTTINISKFFLRHIQFIGTAMGSPEDFKNLLNYIEEQKLTPTIHSTYPFEETIEALKFLEAGNQIGKVIVQF